MPILDMLSNYLLTFQFIYSGKNTSGNEDGNAYYHATCIDYLSPKSLFSKEYGIYVEN